MTSAHLNKYWTVGIFENITISIIITIKIIFRFGNDVTDWMNIIKIETELYGIVYVTQVQKGIMKMHNKCAHGIYSIFLHEIKLIRCFDCGKYFHGINEWWNFSDTSIMSHFQGAIAHQKVDLIFIYINIAVSL